MNSGMQAVASSVSERKRRKKIHISQIVLVFITLVFLVLTLYPFFMMLVRSVKSLPQEMTEPNTITFPFQWANFSEAWVQIDDAILRTFGIVILITVGLLLVASLAAYGLSRYRIPGKGVIVIAFLAVMMVPSSLTLIPQYQLVVVNYGMAGSWMGIIFPTIAGALPMAIFLIRTFFMGLPNEIYEAATIDGCSNLRMYFSIALPLSLPILATQGLLTFMSSYNDFLWPYLIMQSSEQYTISALLVRLTRTAATTQNGYMGVTIAGYVLASIPLLVLFVICNKQFVKGITSGSFKM